jgi:hypothetical protein
VTLRDVLESDPSAQVMIVEMARPRTRSADSGELKLHQGRSSAQGNDKYPGDAKMADQTLITLQIHTLNIEVKDNPVLQDVVALALHIPRALRRDDVVAKE